LLNNLHETLAVGQERSA